MKVDESALKKIAIEFKIAVREFVKGEGESLLDLLSPYDEIESDFILSYFDNYNQGDEYEKTGLRVVFENGVMYVRAYLIKYKTKKATISKINNFNMIEELIEVAVSDDIVSYSNPDILVDCFSILKAKKTFNRSLEEAIIYTKIKSLKKVINDISENGFKSYYCKTLDEVFENLTAPQRNRILGLFDTTIRTSTFKGIRYNETASPVYYSIDMRGQKCKFKFNSLHLRKTAEILDKWLSL